MSAFYETDDNIPSRFRIFLPKKRIFSGLSGQMAEMLAMVHNYEVSYLRIRVNRARRQGLGFWPVS